MAIRPLLDWRSPPAPEGEPHDGIPRHQELQRTCFEAADPDFSVVMVGDPAEMRAPGQAAPPVRFEEYEECDTPGRRPTFKETAKRLRRFRGRKRHIEPRLRPQLMNRIAIRGTLAQ
jgi:hypothetical protein